MRHVERTREQDGGAAVGIQPGTPIGDGCHRMAALAVAPAPLQGDHPDVNGPGLLHAAKLTVPQAAKRLGIGETYMRAIIGSGSIPVVRIMGKTLLLERDLEEYLRSSYGRIMAVKKEVDRLPSLPKHVRESGLIKKAS